MTPTNRAELVELIAEAIRESSPSGNNGYNSAKVILRRLSTAGLVVCPEEPTNAMCNAAWEYDQLFSASGVYEKMINASPFKEVNG